MSTMESKLEAWLRYVAKQEEAIKQDPGDELTEEPKQVIQRAPAAPVAPVAASPASTPTLAPQPTVTATIERQIRQTAIPEPAIPEVEDFLPILRPRVEPPAQPAPPAPQVEQKTEPIQMSAPAPAPPVMTPPAPPRPASPTFFTTPMQTPPAPPRPQADAPVAPPEIKPVEMLAPAPVAVLEVNKAEAVAPAPVVAPQMKPVEAPANSEETQELWARVPKHVQLLVGSSSEEVAQNSYTKGFKESREELIARLLDPTLSLEETARILNVCPTTVRRYTNKEQLKHLRTAGNQRRFRLSDVLVFMEANVSKKGE